jgi:hypothetical protein
MSRDKKISWKVLVLIALVSSIVFFSEVFADPKCEQKAVKVEQKEETKAVKAEQKCEKKATQAEQKEEKKAVQEQKKDN